MTRADEGLAFMLRYENIAWYEGGKVRILDRRIYPRQTKYVECRSHTEVAAAIRDMVTQSEGPYLAAAMGMALAAHEAVTGEAASNSSRIVPFLEKAAGVLSHARPTTSAQMGRITSTSLAVIKQKIDEGASSKEIVGAAFEFALGYAEGNYRKYEVIGQNLAALIPRGGTILTQCFAGTVVGLLLRECRRTGNDIKVICAETRPYFQGSRLTASVACDMGFDVTVISDNMPAYAMQAKQVDVFTSASDVITVDGHIINKVGTFQIALAARHLGIPYYVTGTPDPEHKDLSTTHIEERDSELVLKALDTKITMPGVKGYYPAFDITPPELCTGVVTEKGVLKPTELAKYFEA